MKSLIDEKERGKAQVGPRELKDPRSRQYAIQTVMALKRLAESLRCDQERVARELEEIDRYRHWEVLGYKSKNALLEAELSEVGLANVLATQAKAMANYQTVEAAKPIGTPGPGRGKKTWTNSPALRGGQSSSARIIARLKRDHPDIADAVGRGEYRSARAAGIAAGFIKVPSPLDVAKKAFQKLENRDRARFLNWVNELDL